MPELPEVETVARTLRPHLIGAVPVAVEVRNRNLRRPLPRRFAALLEGRRIETLQRRGKYLIAQFAESPAWIIHLGMSGRLVFSLEPAPLGPHDHVVVRFDRGGTLVFTDPRRFGLMVLADPSSSDLLSGLGPEPFDEEAFHGRYLFELGRRRRRAVKDVLMDQRVVAGIGNIYANEILFAAGLRPRRSVARLTLRDCETLVRATRCVLSEAIEHRGSSVSDFLDGVGRRGGYQWRRRVYDREGEECPRCRMPIKKLVIGQRSSFYCPNCQR
ncbi:MAG: bifunctional DNA-formamidopyrimidine glycosylase/DNA-(apurinic or apyrimidinic site) lyase [Deltaproteobacteria bacterium]|nr:MAG: bifunctional DNA-formamidopyrimidine glycosylase/DNA-(apurinic or apyrimidinic site) lyase [Deltaproteobacteria bacterium]